jgi:hypothetical protein
MLHGRTILSLLATGIIIGVLLGIFLCKGSCNKPGTEIPFDSLSYWKNKAGDLVASVKKSEADFAKKEKHYLDSIAKIYETKPRFIKDYVVITVEGEADLPPEDGTRAEDYFPPVNNCPPQIKNRRQTFSNPYYTANVQVGDSSYLHLSSRDTITTLWKRVREGNIFNRKWYLQYDISFADTSRKVTGIKSYKQADKINEISLGIGTNAIMMNRSIFPLAYLEGEVNTDRVQFALGYGKYFMTDFDEDKYIQFRLKYKFLRHRF